MFSEMTSPNLLKTMGHILRRRANEFPMARPYRWLKDGEQEGPSLSYREVRPKGNGNCHSSSGAWSEEEESIAVVFTGPGIH